MSWLQARVALCQQTLTWASAIMRARLKARGVALVVGRSRNARPGLKRHVDQRTVNTLKVILVLQKVLCLVQS